MKSAGKKDNDTAPRDTEGRQHVEMYLLEQQGLVEKEEQKERA